MDPRAFELLLELEGGLSDRKTDPGGRTNLGVTQYTLSRLRETHRSLPRRVDDLKREHVELIYDVQYWAPFAALPVPLSMVAFGAGVNAGVGRAKKWVQQAVGVAVDGQIGPVTIAAAERRPLIDSISEITARLNAHYMEQHAINREYGLGWGRRAIAFHNLALLTALEPKT